MQIFRFALHLFCAFHIFSGFKTHAQSLDQYAYDVGTPSVSDYYIDPVNGSDDASGQSVSSAWRTVQHAWNQIPTSSTLTQGYRFNLLNGNYGNDELPNYWELKTGTATFPIILQAASGQTSVVFTRDINMANVSYFYLVSVNITPAGGGDAFHCEACDHILLRGNILNGGSKTTGAHETVKVNQSQYIYIENNHILYADDNNIDFVGVQYGHVIGNKVHDAADWCMYVKGGSAYIRVESNEFYNCGTGGFTAGQGSGFQFMTSPWLHYEAYDIKFINNLIFNTEGAAFGVNGGYNVLIAHNTAYKVGTRDHLVEVVFGERTCDGESNGQANSTCAAYKAAGGWGPASIRTDPEPIGNRNVSILNNIVYNPAGTTAAAHFAIYGPRTPSGDVNLSSPQYTDVNLNIQGNIIWNGSPSTPVGIEESDQGCQSSNAQCNLTQINSDNRINVYEPQLRDPSGSDFRPQSGGDLLNLSVAALSSFAGGDRPSSSVPEGILSNAFTRDFSGSTSSGTRIIGAFGSPDASTSPPPIDGIDSPGDVPTTAPTIRSAKISAKRKGKKVTINVSAQINGEVSSVSATISQGKKTLTTVSLAYKSGSRYAAKAKISTNAKRKLTAVFSASNSGGSATKRATTPGP